MPTFREKLIATGPRNLAILFLGGFNLILIQFFIIREINAILRGTEVVYLITTLAYFAGYSVGYGMSGRLTRRWVVIWAWVTWALHLTLPFSIRYICGAAWGLTPETVDHLGPAIAFVFLLFVLAFGLSAFYSLLLPHMIDQDAGKNLVPYYQVELMGAVCSIAVLVVSGRFPLAVPVAYQIDLALLLFLLVGRAAVLPLGLLGVVLYALAFSKIDAHSLAFSYETMFGRDDPKVIFSVNSPYQKVDIIEEGDGDRILYLDGVKFFGGSRLSGHNIYLAEFPARMHRSADILIVGSGSMQSVGRVAPLCERVHTCELDPAVIEGSLAHFGHVNRLDEIENWTYSIDDAKHFLGSDKRQWDLIIMDVPVPLAIQTGLLHSVGFYELARSKLKPGGIISVALSGRLHPKAETPCTVMSSLLEVFDKAWVVTPRSVGRSFAYAGDDLDFDRAGLEMMFKTFGEQTYQVHDENEAAELAKNFDPLTQTNLRYVMRRSWRRVKGRFVPEIDKDD